MNPIETTTNYPAESGAISKIRKNEVFYRTPNQHYGGKRYSGTVNKQTKAVGLTMGKQDAQMNRPVEYAESGKFMRIKNQLVSPGPGLKQPKAKIDLPMSKEGTHPINKGSMKGVTGRTKKSIGKTSIKIDKKRYKKITKRLKKKKE
jgi:hypothetical protein